MRWREASAAILLAGYLHQASANCHIHAPDDYPSFSSRPLVIPVNGNRIDCQSLNLARVGGGGRCHCYSNTSLEPQNLDPLEADSGGQLKEGLSLP